MFEKVEEWSQCYKIGEGSLTKESLESIFGEMPNWKSLLSRLLQGVLVK